MIVYKVNIYDNSQVSNMMGKASQELLKTEIFTSRPKAEAFIIEHARTYAIWACHYKTDKVLLKEAEDLGNLGYYIQEAKVN